MISQAGNMTGDMPLPTVLVDEGNFTWVEEMDTIEGVKRGGTFASPGKKGLEVQIQGTADRTVAPLSTGISIGRLTERPKGNLPRATATAGTYPMRKGKIELYGHFDWVQLVDTHAAITPGTYLAVDRTDASRYVIEEDASAQPTNVIAFENRAENETGYIMVFRKGNNAPQVAAD